MAGGRSDVWSRRITIVLTHFMRVFGKHWLAFANVALALYITLPVLAPVLIHAGHERAGNAIHLVFRPLCHQMPERSFFLYGEAPYYTLSELEEDLDGLVPLRYKGDDVHGYKIAICQRCTAIYGTMLIAGLAFIVLRRWLKPLSLLGFGALLIPMAVDGTGQLVGLWTSSWWSRLITGTLFGLALNWISFPHIERGMREIYAEAIRTIDSWRQT